MTVTTKERPEATPRWTPSERFYRALIFAVGLHAPQARKNRQRDPYLAHLLAVASLVVEDGGTEPQAVAALLHDAAEDHGGRPRLNQIALDFGADVARIVEGCSDTLVRPKPEWHKRKRAYIRRLGKEPADVRRVSLADKVHNARCTVTDLERGEAWGKRFNAQAADQRWYYEALLKCFVATKTRSRHLPEFRRLVNQISAATPVDDR
jgi:(p)ppGpp synthase/HD superfamily hydrolase